VFLGYPGGWIEVHSNFERVSGNEQMIPMRYVESATIRKNDPKWNEWLRVADFFDVLWSHSCILELVYSVSFEWRVKNFINKGGVNRINGRRLIKRHGGFAAFDESDSLANPTA
jgi:hypothetical protein